MTTNISYDWSSIHLLDAALSGMRFTINISPETPHGFIRWFASNPKVTLDVTGLPHLWDLPERMECSLRTDARGLIQLPRQKRIGRLFISEASSIHADRLEDVSHLVIPMAGNFEAHKLKRVYSFVAHNLHPKTVDELVQLGAKDVTRSHWVNGLKIKSPDRPQLRTQKKHLPTPNPILV